MGAFSGVAEARCFFSDLFLDAFAIGLGDFFGFGDGETCVAICSDSLRRLFSSSLTCAWRRVPAIAPEASAVASQMRKRTTATERNRARDTINPEGSNHAAPAAGSGTAGAAERIFSRSRRRMAFNLPPSNNSRQVRYIQVSSTTMEASARYVGL